MTWSLSFQFPNVSIIHLKGKFGARNERVTTVVTLPGAAYWRQLSPNCVRRQETRGDH